MADALKKLKDIPPGDSEDQGIKEYQKQANALAAPVATAAPPVDPGPPELVNPLARYGSRQGEHRYTVDENGNLTPIVVPQESAASGANAHSAPTETAAPRSGMKPIIPQSLSQPMPVYDKGGDVKIPEDHKMTVKADPLKPEDYLSRYGSEAAVANRPAVEKPVPSGLRKITEPEDENTQQLNRINQQNEQQRLMQQQTPMSSYPIYDEGGDVDVNDGKHQVAVLQEGEQVLKPDEAAQYRKEHAAKGAPAGFPGMVLPGPDNSEWDSEHKAESKEYPGGARMNIDNAKVGEGDQDAKTFPTAIPTEATAKTPLKPHSQVIEEQAKAKAADQVNNPNATGQPSSANTTAETLPEGVEKPELLKEEKAKPTLGTPLGTAWLKKMGIPAEPTTSESTETQVQPAAQQGLKPVVPADMHQDKAGGPLTIGPTAEPTGKDAHNAKIKEYDAQYQSLLDQAANTTDPSERAQFAEQAARTKSAELEYKKGHPWGSPESSHPGILGKLGHAASKFGNIAGDVFAPGLMAAIPGTDFHNAIERGQAQGQVKEATAQATAREAEENKPDTMAGTLKEATQGGMIDPNATGDLVGVPQQTLYNDKTGKLEYKGPMPPKEGAANGPATPAELADVNTRIKNNPSLSPKQQEELQFPTNYKPTTGDVKERLANIKDIEDAARQGKQDEFNNAIRKLTEENSSLMVKAHLQEMEEKKQAADAKAAQSADVATTGLYVQEQYRDAMKDWYKSGNFAKDSGLVTEVVNKEHGSQGAFGAATGGAVVGSLFGPEGTAIGAGVGALTGMFAGPINGYLDTLKKQGISDEGYAAMQAYFNTLPARFAYEVGVQGLSASALRSSQLIQKVLNTVPPPNTPEANFDNSFNQYYNPMKRLTEGKVKLTAPKGYVPPSKDDVYPTQAPKKTEATPQAKKAAPGGYSPDNPFAPKPAAQ